jgi:biotin carboxyl carrier protein
VTGPSRFTVEVDGAAFVVELEEGPGGRLDVRIDGEPVAVDARLPPAGTGSILVGGASYVVDLPEAPGEVVLVDGEPFETRVGTPGRRAGTAGLRPAVVDGQRLVAPLPGKVVAILVEVGQRVDAGAGLVVLEAMKMENEFRAAVAGVVAELPVDVGQAVNAGDLLAVIT